MAYNSDTVTESSKMLELKEYNTVEVFMCSWRDVVMSM